MGSTRSRGAFELARLGMTQPAIAQRLGVSNGIVAMWMSDERKPSLPNRTAMKAKFGIAIEWWDEPAKRPKKASASVPPPPDAASPAGKDPPADPPGDQSSDANATLVKHRIETLEKMVAELMTSIQRDTRSTPLERAKVMSSLATTLGTIRKLKGEEISELKVTRHPKWLELKELIFSILAGFPDARRALLDAIDGVDRKAG